MVKSQGESGKFKLMLIILMVRTALAEDNEYCKLKTCPNRSHTLCRYEEFGLRFGPACENKKLFRKELREIFLKMFPTTHSQFRLPEVMRREKLPALPALMPILALQWDEELAMAAQVWANQCQGIPDTCRNVARFNVTQRVSVITSDTVEASIAYNIAVREWFKEESERILNIQISSLEESSNSASKQFARLPWSNANRVGCGFNQFILFEEVTSYFVCNYGYEDPNQEDTNLINQEDTNLINQEQTYLITQ